MVYANNMHGYVVTLITPRAGFLPGEQGVASAPPRLWLAPSWELVLKAHQFKCFEIFNCYIMYKVRYVYTFWLYKIPSSFSTPYSDHISKFSSVNNKVMSLFIILQCRCQWIDVILCMGTSLAPCIECVMQVSYKKCC